MSSKRKQSTGKVSATDEKKSADMRQVPIGRISATERVANTSDTFYFWLPDGIIVNPFDIVDVEQVNAAGESPSHTYGIVSMLEHQTDAPNHLANVISSNFGDVNEPSNSNRLGATVAQASVLSNNRDIYMPVISDKLVHFASPDGINQALGIEALVRERPHDAIPAGLIKMSNGINAIAFIDKRYVLGPESAHINMTGISGLATKTSYAMFIIQSILQSTESPDNIAVIVLNVKQADLLQIDKPNPHLSEEQKDIWRKLGLEPKPFKNVKYLLPRGMRGTANSYPPTPSKEKYDIYAYDLPSTADKLDLLFSNVEDSTGTMEGISGEIMTALATGEREFAHVQSWEALLRHLQDLQGHGKWRGMYAPSSIGKFRRHLSNIVRTRQTGIFVESRSKKEKLLNDELVNIDGGWTYVVDIAKLSDTEQALVFGDILRTIYTLKSGGADEEDIGLSRQEGVRTTKAPIPEKVIIFVDELNKYAPGGGRQSPITPQLLDVSERGRSMGVILVSAQQFMSAVHPRVIGNSATKVIGCTGSSEANQDPYRFLTQGMRSAITRLAKGELVINHPIYRQSVKILFPMPAYRQEI